MATREFTKQELSQYNGQDGQPTYVAYKGQVYDLSRSFLWRGGRHMARHHAGQDLTKGLVRAPHNASRLKRYPVVGVLRDEHEQGDS